MNDNIIVFGETNFRNRRQRFGIKESDRGKHVYIIGKTGMGKTALLRNMIVQDIQEGRGLAFVDPHGDTAEELLDFVPKERIKDVIYFNPADTEFPIAFNILEKVDPKLRHLVAAGLMAVFKKIWQDLWSARMEYILNNTILALLEVEDSTILGVNRMFSDKDYRKKIVDQITDPLVKSFWVDEFAKYTDRLATEATAAIQNKIGQFVSSSLIRNIVGQTKTSIDVRDAIDNNKIIIINLSRGQIGEDASRLLGALFITKIQLAAMSRADIPEEKRTNFFLYVDEFQHFATESFANILSEARKFKLNLIMAHQYIAQMEEKVRDAVFGNVGTLITFRVGAEDAAALEKEFSPEFTMNDLVNLDKYNIFLKLMIDGVTSSAFSAATLFPFPPLDTSFKDDIIKSSRELYGTSYEDVEDEINKWSKREKPERDDRRDNRNNKSFNQKRQFDRPHNKPNNKPRDDRKKSYNSPSMSLGDAFNKGAVNFKGRKISESKREPVEPDIEGLRSLLSDEINNNSSNN